MKHSYWVPVYPSKTHPKRSIRKLISEFPELTLNAIGEGIEPTQDEASARELFAEATRRGYRCSFRISTEYGREDALGADLGFLHASPSDMDGFQGTLPKDAFDFSTGCPHCGVGAAVVKPHVLLERSIKCKGNFYDSETMTNWMFLRSEIGRAVIEATGQPWCMRHPVTRAGRVVKEWMEPVPCATMPPLSRNSKGVRFGSTTGATDWEMGGGPEIVPPCPACGREIWDYDEEQHTRLVYPRAAIEAAQKHAVVIMYEPYGGFPLLDPIKRTWRDYVAGLPRLLFSPAAIRAILPYTQTEHFRSSAYFEPVFSE